MPIIVTDFKWSETEKLVKIHLPLHGVHQSKADIFTSPKYIKASYEQFFFEVFLLHDIDTSESRCTITPSEIVFELFKRESQMWSKLEVDLPKWEKMELKKRIIQEQHEKFQNECRERKNKRHELKRVAVNEQISLDTRKRELIENIKNAAKTAALGDLKEWNNESTPKKTYTKKKNIVLRPTQINYNSLPSAGQPVPLPRQTSSLEVDFTQRAFPTPSRESKLEEENEWLRKQALVRRSVGFVSEDLRPEEKNPQYLKAKGEEFFKAKNYLGSISAYSFAIKLCSEYPDLYIGRSRAHFEQENYMKAVHDCSTALELLRPAVSANLNERVESISRRGMCLWKLGMVAEGIQELEAAIKLQPNDPELRNQLQLIKSAGE